MTQKIADTSEHISKGGRLKEYWDERGVKQRRSFFVNWDEKDIDVRALLEKYKLKGFEFGRYVNNEDRYDFLLATKDSLKDLARLLKTDNLGIEYKIGIAFGARGQGGRAAAHYEPLLNMINLTKGKGAQCMAHEYGHALDYNIGTYIDQNGKYRALSAGRSMAKFPEDNTGGTCRLLMRKLIREIKVTDSYKRLKKASDYWHYNTEVFARYFEQWCCYTLRAAKQSNGFLAKAWTVYTTKPQYLTEADFKKVLPTGDKLMKNIGLVLNGKPTERFMELEVVNPEKVKKAAAPKKPAKAKKEPVKKAAAPAKTASKAAPKKVAVKETSLRFYQEPKEYEKAFKEMAKFTSDDKIRPVMATVYHHNGDMVATDGHVLAVIRGTKYPDSREGKMIFARKFPHVTEGNKDVTKQPGDTLIGRYPLYDQVLKGASKSAGPSVQIDVDAELKKVKEEVARQRKLRAEAKKKPWNWLEEQGFYDNSSKSCIPYKFNKYHVDPRLLAKVLQFFKNSGVKTVLFYHDKEKPSSRAGLFIKNNMGALLMPMMMDK